MVLALGDEMSMGRVMGRVSAYVGRGVRCGEEEEKEMMYVGGWHYGYLIMNPCI